jgi:predicted transcriptional regulator
MYVMREKTEPVTIRLTPSVKGKLQALAESERRTLSQFIGLILEGFLVDQETRKPGAKK